MLAALAGAAGCGAGSSAEPTPAELTVELQALLDRRAEALDRGDTGAYLAPLAPAAREVETPLAEGAAAVPAGEFSFLISERAIPSGLLPATGIPVSLNYRYEGLPADNVFSVPLVYRVDRTGSELVVTDSQPGAGPVPMWATGPVQATFSEHFLALSRPDLDDVQDILSTAEQARRELEQALPFELDSRFLVVLAADELEYVRFVPPGGMVAGPRVAQANISFRATPEQFHVEGRHILVNLETLARERTGLQTFIHELAHLALAEVTRPITPGWVAESAAMWLAGQKTNWTERVATGNFEDLSFAELSRTRQLGEDDPSGQAAALQYSYAAGAAGYLIETFGADDYWAFYRSYADVPPQVLYQSLPAGGDTGGDALGDLAARVTGEQLREIFGLTEAELDVEVRNWIRQNR